jgi:hypothetical protein
MVCHADQNVLHKLIWNLEGAVPQHEGKPNPKHNVNIFMRVPTDEKVERGSFEAVLAEKIGDGLPEI